jgi:hypothetical protein
MLGALGFILDGIELIGSYVLWALESIANVLLGVIAAAAAALMALLPSMSSAPSLGTPTWLSWLNWFFPVGDLLAGLTALLGLWTGFLVVRWGLRLVRAI